MVSSRNLDIVRRQDYQTVMADDSERPSTETAPPRQSWIVPLIALAMFAMFVWLFLGGGPPTGGRELPKKRESPTSPAGSDRR